MSRRRRDSDDDSIVAIGTLRPGSVDTPSQRGSRCQGARVGAPYAGRRRKSHIRDAPVITPAAAAPVAPMT